MNQSPGETEDAKPRRFRNDDEYLAWINEHQDGYVLTSNQSLTPRHTVIHRAACDRIKVLKGNAKPGGFTNDYVKVYAPTIALLKTWLFGERPDAEYRECSICAGS